MFVHLRQDKISRHQQFRSELVRFDFFRDTAIRGSTITKTQFVTAIGMRGGVLVKKKVPKLVSDCKAPSPSGMIHVNDYCPASPSGGFFERNEHTRDVIIHFCLNKKSVLLRDPLNWDTRGSDLLFGEQPTCLLPNWL